MHTFTCDSVVLPGSWSWHVVGLLGPPPNSVLNWVWRACWVLCYLWRLYTLALPAGYGRHPPTRWGQRTCLERGWMEPCYPGSALRPLLLLPQAPPLLETCTAVACDTHTYTQNTPTWHPRHKYTNTRHMHKQVQTHGIIFMLDEGLLKLEAFINIMMKRTLRFFSIFKL